MAGFNKIELGTRFYVDGKECIKSAEILFQDKTRGFRSQYGVLLIHGIELLLKSYLLIKNTNIPDDKKSVDFYLKKLGHKYNKIYKECIKNGTDLINNNLKDHFKFLGNNYYEDSVGVRYIQNSGVTQFNPTIFVALDKYLIKQIHNLLFPHTSYNNN